MLLNYSSVTLILLFSIFIPTIASREPYRSNFKACCALGKQSANSTNSCNDYSRLIDDSGGCRYAYTICCNQNKRINECERGKRHAYSGLSCEDLKRGSTCDALTDCCNCCELGIQTRKNGDDCTSTPELNAECNSIFMDCCRHATSYDDCRNSHYCPNGQICENTHSGPICKCPSGFEKDLLSNHCIDVDECRKNTICSSGYTCQNSAGSYSCTRSCGVGYYYEINANQCKDLNECIRDGHNCGRGMRCENFPGAYRCIREKPCGTGYSVNVYTQDCDDIDECALSLHDCGRGFICLNVPGTFRCRQKECGFGYIFNYNIGDCEAIICRTGYELDSSGKCVDIDECARHQNTCHFNERCDNTPGSYKCVLVLICDEGYQLNVNKTECIDIDECAVGRHTCPSMATCVNTPRSYKCVCPNGYKLDETRNICEDIDECAFGKVCPSNSNCLNSPGSYSCDCKQGFSLVSHIFQSCIDIDECATPNTCDHKCVNTYGSYQCTCNEGYKLSSDRRTCIDIDECSLQKSICSGICINTPGSYQCSCPAGFTLKQGRICEDIDECEQRTHNCAPRDICVNTRGSFQCIKVDCPDGYSFIHDIKASRCDRANVVCKYGDMECFRRPMKIFYSHSTFSHLVPVPIKIFTTRVSTYSRRIKFKHDLKLINADGSHLREDQFQVKQVDSNTFEIYLLEPCAAAENLQLDLKIEFYNENTFQSCLLNKVFVFVTE